MSKQSTDADVAFIAALAELLNRNELTELSVRREYGDNDSLDVRVVKAPPVVHQVAAPVYATAPAAGVAVAPAPVTVDDPAQHPGAVTSPMVGTVYLSPEPGKPVFISVGKTVKEGDTLFIIEAMKTMNAITAPKGGTVTEIQVTDGNPVEFGQTLCVIA